METIGFVGGLITSLGGVPQIYKIIQTRQTKDLSWVMLCSWFVGLSMTTVYAFSIRAVPICVNCVVSLINTCTISSLKIFYENYAADECEEGKPLGLNDYC